MGKLRCCVIDDEPLAAKLIASYVERTPTLQLVGIYNSATEAVRSILDGDVDLAFLDIEMPQLNGMEFARVIPSSCRIIFTTAYDQYAIQGYRVNAVDYLLKPISYDEFLQAANRAVQLHQMSHPESVDVNQAEGKREYMLIKSEYRLVQVHIPDILYVEGLKDYIKIYVSDQAKPILTLMSMKSIEQALPKSQFLRVHRSYIINTQKISIIERNHVIINGQVIPISESYRQAFAEYVSKLNPEG